MGTRTAHLLNRLLTTLCFLLLLPLLALWIVSYASPRQLDHNVGPVPEQDQLRLVPTRGAVWYLRFQTHPADAPAPPPPPGPPTPWTIAPLRDPAWDTHFTPDQTGPIRLGFAHKLRPLWGSALYVDPRTGRTLGGTSVTDERIVRFPLAAPILALMAWPVTQLARDLRHRRRAAREARAAAQPPSTPGLLRTLAARLFGLASLTSALLLALTLWAAFAARRHQAHLQCTAPMPGGVPSSPVSGRFQASLIVHADGWELARSYQSEAEHRLPPRPSYTISFEVERPGAIPTTALSAYPRANTARLLGFVVGSQDVPPAIALRSWRSSFVSPNMLHLTSQALLVPHWATCLATAVLPAAWLARQRTLRRRARRHALGLCQHCGYDLRATPDRCPECGHTPAR